MKWWKGTLFGVVSADLGLRFSAELVGLVGLLLRFVVEVLGLGWTVGISAGAVLGTRVLLGLNLAGWAFGWLLFWLLLFWSTPLFFPRQGTHEDDWTAGLGNRLLLATATVGVGITIEGWLAALETRYNVQNIVSSPVFVAPVEAAGLLALTLVGYVVVANQTPKTWVDRKYLYEPSARYEGGTVTGDRYLLAVVVLGTILATMAVLFPLPEFLLVSLQAADFLVAVGVAVTGAEYVIAARNDIVEGMTGAVLSVWADLRELFHLVYIVTPLLLFWLLAVGAVARIAFESAVASSPLGLAVYGLCFVTFGVQVTFHSYRLSERVRDRLVDAESTTRGEALHAEMKPRIPLVLVPAGLAWSVQTIMIRQRSVGGETPSVIYDLPFEPELALLAAVAFVLSVLTVAHPGLFPDFGDDEDSDSAASDHATAAVGTTLLVLFAGVVPGVYTEPTGLPRVAAQVVAVGVTFLAPWLAPRVLLGSQGSEWNRLLTGLKRAGLMFVIGLGFSLVVGAVLFLLFGEIPRRLDVYVAVVSLPWYVAGIALVLFGFLLPFHYGSRDG